VVQAAVDRIIGKQGWLEPVGDFIQGVVGGFYGALGRPGRLLKDTLHGQKVLGHPLHPALTDVPLGAWTAGVIGDYVALANHSVPMAVGDIPLAIGIVGAVLAALSGYTDHYDTYGHERRVATAHGLTMTVVLVIELVSLGFRWWGGPGLHVAAVVLATVGLLIALAGAYLGGELVFRLGTMVNRNAFTELPEDWVDVGRTGDFTDDQPRRVQAGSMPVLVIRRSGVLRAIGGVCSHAGGPLDEGTFEGDVVTCPWHGSRFCLRDGRALGGPATFAVPAFEAQERDGRVLVKPA
jgi:nitrite reductase/ring-hydroxylating ferredoxin subunit/uncharacterized membrane protein